MFKVLSLLVFLSACSTAMGTQIAHTRREEIGLPDTGTNECVSECSKMSATAKICVPGLDGCLCDTTGAADIKTCFDCQLNLNSTSNVTKNAIAETATSLDNSCIAVGKPYSPSLKDSIKGLPVNSTSTSNGTTTNGTTTNNNGTNGDNKSSSIRVYPYEASIPSILAISVIILATTF